tara:strand:+ start:9609 stop:10796 length:1188 start_codon:yes stop_codon:yes gene_type:complete
LIYFIKKKYTKFSLFALVISFIGVSLFSGANTISAQVPPTPTPTPVPSGSAPPVQIKEAIAFKNIKSATADDFFVLIRYELDIGDEPYQYWCEQQTATSPNTSMYLLNDTGCNLDIPNPSFPFSLKSGRLEIEYLDSSMTFPTSSPHISLTKIPRIDKGLMGLYASAPAASTYGWNTGANVCFRYSTDFFDNGANTTSNCKAVTRISGGTVGLANEISGGSGILYNLESDLGLPLNTLVSSEGLVTPAGQIYLEEALNGVVTVAVNSEGKTVFQLGANRPNRNFTDTGSNIPLQVNIYATATTSGVTENLNVLSGQYLGFSSGTYFGALLFIMLGIMTAAAVTYATENSFLGLLSGVMMILPGIFIGAVSIGFLFTLMAILIVFGSWYWIRRSPE